MHALLPRRRSAERAFTLACASARRWRRCCARGSETTCGGRLTAPRSWSRPHAKPTAAAKSSAPSPSTAAPPKVCSRCTARASGTKKPRPSPRDASRPAKPSSAAATTRRPLRQRLPRHQFQRRQRRVVVVVAASAAAGAKPRPRWPTASRACATLPASQRPTRSETSPASPRRELTGRHGRRLASPCLTPRRRRRSSHAISGHSA